MKPSLIPKGLKVWWNKQTSPWSMIVYHGLEFQEVKANYLYATSGDKELLLLAADSPFKHPTEMIVKSKSGFSRYMSLEGAPNPLLNPFCGYVTKLYYYLIVNPDGAPVIEQEPKLINEQEYKLLAQGSELKERDEVCPKHSSTEKKTVGGVVKMKGTLEAKVTAHWNSKSYAILFGILAVILFFLYLAYDLLPLSSGLKIAVISVVLLVLILVIYWKRYSVLMFTRWLDRKFTAKKTYRYK